MLKKLLKVIVSLVAFVIFVGSVGGICGFTERTDGGIEKVSALDVGKLPKFRVDKEQTDYYGNKVTVPVDCVEIGNTGIYKYYLADHTRNIIVSHCYESPVGISADEYESINGVFDDPIAITV